MATETDFAFDPRWVRSLPDEWEDTLCEYRNASSSMHRMGELHKGHGS